MDFDFDENLNPFNIDLNNLENEYHARDIPIQEEKQKDIQLDTNLQEIFPDADEVLYTNEERKIRQQYFPYSFRSRPKNEPITEPDEIPIELEFFSGGVEQVNSLYNRLNSHGLVRGNEDFVEFLATDECQEALQRDDISIHVPTGNIFINNQNTEESIYTFLDNQQDETKKEIPLDFSYDDNLTDYMTKYLPAINDYDEVKYDFLANKNSKFLFNLFNKHQENRGKKKQPVRHTKVPADGYALQKLQDRNCPYFINRIIEFLQGVFGLNDVITTVADEVNILNNTRANFEIVKNLYNELLTTVGINLHEYFINLDIEEKQKIDTDLTNNNYFTWDPHEVYIQTRILATYRDFFYDTGRFPGRNTLIHVPIANMPPFLNTNDWISPRSLYETYLGRDMQGLTSVQFLAAFNRFLGGDKEISRNGMSEFFHNLSWQALTNDNDSVKIKFEATTELVKSINFLLQQNIYEAKKRAIVINYKIQKKILEKEPEKQKSTNEIVEQKVVTDILNNDNTDYAPRYNFPTVKTDEEADRDRINENKNYIATELVKKQRDIQIIDDITKKNQKGLIRSVADPGDGFITNENITLTDYTRNDNNEPVQPQLDEGVLNVMKDMVKITGEQVAVMDSIPPPLENIPQNEPVQIITQPDLQDIITKDEPDLTDILKIKKEIADVISTSDVINNPPLRGVTTGEAVDVVNLPDLINIPPNNLIPNPADIGLIPPVPTGNKEVDDINYDDYLDTLQQIRPDLFVSEDDESDNDVNEPIVVPQVKPKDEPDFIPVGGIKTEPDYTPFVDADGNVFIKGEPDIRSSITSDIEIIDSEDERKPDISGDSDVDTILYTPDVGDIPDGEADSDAETISYLPNLNRRNEIYRIRAKKRALKTLAKRKKHKKTHILVPTDVPITSTDPDEIIGDPNVTTILPPLIKTEVTGDNSDIDIGDDSDIDTIPYMPDVGNIPDVELIQMQKLFPTFQI